MYNLTAFHIKVKFEEKKMDTTSYFIILQIGILTILVSRILSIQFLFKEKFINASSTSKQLASRQSSTLVFVFQMQIAQCVSQTGRKSPLTISLYESHT